MSQKIRIATWNVERPKKMGYKAQEKNSVIIQKLNEIKAHIWILTETNTIIKPEGDYHDAATPHPSHHDDGENRTTIWSCWPVKRRLNTFEATTAVCREIETLAGALLVYGTIITYHGDKGPTGQSRVWEEHYKSIENHQLDWARLNQEGMALCVAGDFNETLKGRMWYGTKEGRKLLQEALDRNNLVSITAQLDTYCIDHICLSQNWAKYVCDKGFWSAPTYPNLKKQVSDHKGFWVDLNFD